MSNDSAESGVSYAPGTRVRVKRGTPDPDYPDIPLGGWVGEIIAIDTEQKPTLYTILWDDATIEAIHPVYRVRCERDDLDPEKCALDGSVLELDDGGPLNIEQPGPLTPRPLDPTIPLDRARQVFGLTSDDALPALTASSLARWHQELSGRIKFPWTVQVDVDGRTSVHPLLVTRLLAVEEVEPELGIVVEATVGERSGPVSLLMVRPIPGDPALDLVEAYQDWFLVCDQTEPSDSPVPRAVLGVMTALLGLMLVLLGMLAGGVLATVEEAPVWATWGAGLCAVLGMMLGASTELKMRQRAGQPGNIVLGSLIGAFIGGVTGGLGAIVASAYVGAIPGAIAGSLLAGLLNALGKQAPSVLFAVVGIWLGSLVYCIVLGWEQALWGVLIGAAAGFVPAMGLSLLRRR